MQYVDAVPGFAQWTNSNGWDVKTLMEYVGWRDVQLAMRYVDGADPFAQHRSRESGLVNESKVPQLEIT